MIGKDLRLSLILLLLLCCGCSSELQIYCPYKCQCFTPAQVLCSDERMRTLPTDMSSQVKDLIIMTSAVAYLFPHTLKESPQLTKLIFLNNALRSVHVESLADLTELEELEISGNPWLGHLFLGTFSKQGNLTRLMLNFNRLKTLLPGMFDSLQQLEVLQMKSNIISSLSPFLFRNLHKLRVLDLSHNKLDGVSAQILCGLSSLETLKLNNNLISNFTSDSFSDVSQLKELHLEGNRIAQLDDDVFSILTKLEVMSLRGNLLTSFSDKIFGSAPSNLKELNLKGNRLMELSSLTRLTTLTDLILSSNLLSSLTEDMFVNVTSLEYLDLSENLLSVLPKGIFKELFRLQGLHLHKNNLSSVDAELFEDQIVVQQLYLSDNRLQMLPYGLFDPFASEHTVRLHGNPWKCDCGLQYLHDWLQKNSRDVEMLDQVLCESPESLSKRTVVSVKKDQLVCHLTQDQTPLLSSCTLQTSTNMLVIKCNRQKCSPMTVKVQFQDDTDGTTEEHTLRKEPIFSQCSNETIIARD